MLETNHRLQVGDARELSSIPDESVDLVVTSPPYPMIEMWDEAFSSMSETFRGLLGAGDSNGAFEACHRELDQAWHECFRVLRSGGIACINIGDATRTIGGSFQIYPNHAMTLIAARSCGFESLPDILWRKPTNAPNKFMGSGMLPAGAYVTYEHEYILVLRKGGKREFKTIEEKERRRRSAYFWEERNIWFSDVWSDLRGTSQSLCDRASRDRSGAFPFELAYRLINMYSLQGDTVLDPFGGTGTTAGAAIASARDSVSIECDPSLMPSIRSTLDASVALGAHRAKTRLADHLDFVSTRQAAGKTLKHQNTEYGFPVVTRQERELLVMKPIDLRMTSEDSLVARHQFASVPDDELQLSLFGSS